MLTNQILQFTSIFLKQLIYCIVILAFPSKVLICIDGYEFTYKSISDSEFTYKSISDSEFTYKSISDSRDSNASSAMPAIWLNCKSLKTF